MFCHVCNKELPEERIRLCDFYDCPNPKATSYTEVETKMAKCDRCGRTNEPCHICDCQLGFGVLQDKVDMRFRAACAIASGMWANPAIFDKENMSCSYLAVKEADLLIAEFNKGS